MYSAENGQEACAKAHALAQTGLKFHLVLMDLTMPVLDGVDATEILRQHMYHGGAVPIVSLSSRSETRYPDGAAAVFSGKVRGAARAGVGALLPGNHS
jgi:CheY-like chemotaxis protein